MKKREKMIPGKERQRGDLIQVFLICLKGQTTEKYLSMVKDIVRYTLAVRLVYSRGQLVIIAGLSMLYFRKIFLMLKKIMKITKLDFAVAD